MFARTLDTGLILCAYLCIAAFLLSQLILQIRVYPFKLRQFFARLFQLQEKREYSRTVLLVFFTLRVFLQKNTNARNFRGTSALISPQGWRGSRCLCLPGSCQQTLSPPLASAQPVPHQNTHHSSRHLAKHLLEQKSNIASKWNWLSDKTTTTAVQLWRFTYAFRNSLSCVVAAAGAKQWLATDSLFSNGKCWGEPPLADLCSPDSWSVFWIQSLVLCSCKNVLESAVACESSWWATCSDIRL